MRKRIFSFVVALVVALGSIGFSVISVFAASNLATIVLPTSVPTVLPTGGIYRFSPTSNVPVQYLKITNLDNSAATGSAGELKFTITLTNGSWRSELPDVVDWASYGTVVGVSPLKITLNARTAEDATSIAGATLEFSTGTGGAASAVVTIPAEYANGTVGVGLTTLYVPMLVDVKGSAGDYATFSLSLLSSTATVFDRSGPFPLALVGGTVSTVTDVKVSAVSKGDFQVALDANPVFVAEQTAGSLASSGTILLSVPTGFTLLSNIVLTGYQEFAFGGSRALTSGSFTHSSPYYPNAADRTKVAVDYSLLTGVSSTASYFVLSGLSIVPVSAGTTSQKMDLQVSVPLKNGSTSSVQVELGKYAPYGMQTAVQSAVPSLFSGRFPVDPYDVTIKSAELVLTEATAGSWFGQPLTFTLPDGVKLRAATIEISDTTGSKETVSIINTTGNDTKNNIVMTNESITVSRYTSSSARTLKVIFYLSIDAGYPDNTISVVVTGNITSGTSSNFFTIANVLQPLSVTVENTEVIAGQRQVSTGGIVLTESRIGALEGTVRISLDNGVVVEGHSGKFISFSTAQAVADSASGIKISNARIDSKTGDILFSVLSPSTLAPATITISDIKTDVGLQFVLVGDYRISVSGTVLVGNVGYALTGELLPARFDTVGFHPADAYLTVVSVPSTSGNNNNNTNPGTSDGTDKPDTDSPDGSEGGGNSSLPPEPELVAYLDFNTSSIVYPDGKSVALSPQHIVVNGRALVPIRNVAVLIGIPEDNISWNALTFEATITGNDGTVVVFTSNSESYRINGIRKIMDVPVTNKDGRLFLPVRALVEALNGAAIWNDNTRRVMIEMPPASTSTTPPSSGNSGTPKDVNDSETTTPAPTPTPPSSGGGWNYVGK